MPSSFAAADAKSSAAVSATFGEDLRFLPWTRGGYTTGGGADNSRSAVTFKAILSGSLGSQNSSGDRPQNFTLDVNTRNRRVSCDLQAWPASARKGDRIKALDQPGQPTYEISEEPVIDGMNRWIADMVLT